MNLITNATPHRHSILCMLFITMLSCNPILANELVSAKVKYKLDNISEIYFQSGVHDLDFRGVQVPHPNEPAKITYIVPGNVIVLFKNNGVLPYHEYITTSNSGDYGISATRGDLFVIPIVQNGPASIPTCCSPNTSESISETTGANGILEKTVQFFNITIAGTPETVIVTAELSSRRGNKEVFPKYVHVSIYELLIQDNDLPKFVPTIVFNSQRKYCLPYLGLEDELQLQHGSRADLKDEGLDVVTGCPSTPRKRS